MKTKRYKLKRDLPTFKAGEIFYISDSGNLLRESDNVPAYSWSTIDKFPNILADWFEEVKEPTRWKPVPGDTYWSLDGVGYVNYYESSGGTYTASRVSIGNCFQTREEAEKAVEYLKALAVVRGDATSEFVKYNDNWFIGYDPEHKSIEAFCNAYTARNGIFGLPYFATKEDAERSIEQHKNEWLTIFGIEDSAEEEDEAQK